MPTSSGRLLGKLLASEMKAHGAVKLSTHVWAIDRGWYLGIINTNITKRAGLKSYSLITAIHWLWDDKEYVSIDFGRAETAPIAEDDPSMEEQLPCMVKDEIARTLELVQRVDNVQKAYQEVRHVASGSDPRKLYHEYVLSVLCQSSGHKSLFRELTRSCHGPQGWKADLRNRAEQIHSCASLELAATEIEKMVVAARKTKKLPQVDNPLSS